jgi:hypothetical protein
MSIKMIVVDLDGTLMRDDKTVSERTICALKKCREKGIKVAYATARGNAEQILPSELIFDGSVRNGGASVFADGKKIYTRSVSTKQVCDFLVACDKANIKIGGNIEGSSRHFGNFKFNEIWDYITDYDVVDFNGLDLQAEKIFALPESQKDMEVIRKNLPDCLNMIIARDDMIMFMNHEAVKSKAVAALAEHWSIKQEEIVAFGDDLIDVDLLEFCGVGLAMENALDEVKKAADFVCGTNENDGVAEWLEENILEVNYAK